MTLVWWLILGSIAVFYVRGDYPVESKSAKKFQFAIMQQNLQTIIMSIEERLRNLDHIYSSRSNNGIEGALEQFSRKLDKIELKLDRIESIVNIQLDKISENISTQFLKQDLNRDHIKRKLDIIHENVNHRFTYSEIILDTIGRNAHENNNFFRNKLQKLEDKVISRISDVEVAISDSIVSIEEAKDICALNGNHTKDKLPDATEKIMLEYFNLLEKKYNLGHKEIVDSIKVAESNIKSSINKTYEVIIDVEDNLNEFSNKISEMGDTIYDKTECIEIHTIGAAKTINLTRNELQNGFRSLSVQIGKNEKSQMMMDSSQILHDMDKKIETNFENVLLAQNIFLETCHRLQMDESQIENKIGDIFQKLLDTLDAKIMVETDDVKEISKVLKNLLTIKTKPKIKTVDMQYLDNLLKTVEQMQNQLLSIENGINETIITSKENLEYQSNFTWSLADIHELIHSHFDSHKIIPNNVSMNNKVNNINTTENDKNIDLQIMCIFHNINCSILDNSQNNQTVNDNIFFENNNENIDKFDVLDVDIEVRSLMNANNDMSSMERKHDFSVNTSNNYEQNFVDDEELKKFQRIVESPITE